MKILFVCTGNTCRSVLAHQWLLHRLKNEGLQWEVRSAGVSADPYYPVPDEVAAALKEAGAPPEFKHTPTRLDKAAVEWADQILVMQEIHKAVIDRQYPAAAKKTRLLAGKDVPDPIGSGLDAYRKTLGVVKGAIDELIKHAKHPSKG